MHDVVGAYQRLERLYRLYIKSAFPLRSQILAQERDRVLQESSFLSQPPLLETVPIYPTSELTLERATAQLGSEYGGLAALGQGLFPSSQKLYRHQWQSLSAVINQGQDLVVTTGTGSGKTECFLLPLFAQLARESATWEPARRPRPSRRWWDPSASGVQKAERVAQWEHAERPAALRAVILYPLNALVEDQLRRLRLALDDDNVHRWLDDNRGGNRITFGRYTGITPLAGREAPTRRERLRGELAEMEAQRAEVTKLAREKPDEYKDAQYFFPRLDGGEMWSRWDMQESPPDILITNYSMLNIMMMRDIESPIFQMTRDWLAEADHPERQFSLIVDELHAYRGTPGTEVAYILRLLLARLGLAPDSPKLRILTTTASLENDERGRKFLREFFGRDRFEFVAGEQVPPSPGARTLMAPYQQAFAAFARAVEPDVRVGPPEPASVSTEMSTLAAQLGQTGLASLPIEQRLGNALTDIRAGDALRDACQAVNGSVRPTKINDLSLMIFPNNAADASPGDVAPVCSDAMRGLLLAVGMSENPATGRSPQPVRGHFFYHNLQNLWVCCNPECTDSSIDAVARAAQPEAQRPTVGAVHPANRLACGCGSRVLDLIVCEVCGDAFLGGYKAEIEVARQQKLTILTSDQPDLESMPDRVNMSQRHAQYAVFWPLPYGTPWSLRPIDEEWVIDGIKRQWRQAKINRITGRLCADSAEPKQDEIAGWLYTIPGKAGERVSAMPSKCPRCDADYRRRKTVKTPLRNHRTGFQKATQVLSSALFREMAPSGGEGPSPTRKLVIFSDSRQDAAKLAAGIERDHYRDMLRLALIQSFRAYWQDLVSFLRVMLAANPTSLAMLAALNPELHAQVELGQQLHDQEGQRRFQASMDQTITTEALSWAMGMASANPAARDEWLSLIQTYPGRVPLRHLRGKVFNTILALGMNPGGSSYSAASYRNAGSARSAWYTCYNWTPQGPLPIVNPGEDQRGHLVRLQDLLMGEMMYALFPHMARTLEGLGQGWVSYRPVSSPSPDVISTTDAVIRQLGVRRMHEYAQFSYAGNDTELRRFSTQYINNRGLTTPEIHAQLMQSGAGVPSSSGLTLAPDNLTLVPVEQNGDTRITGYRCPDCNAFYLHDVGICPEDRHPTRLVESAVGTDFDYYTALTPRSGSSSNYFRMSSEELTGQTDKNTRTERQRWFQEIFIGKDIKQVHGVDLLSVTTTMEAGVDIGALNAVMMANMPPRRFNYQQRVGRAGRRTSGVSFAVTFCRGRSHDDFYFQRPEMMTGDPPPPPYVDMNSEPIFQRVLAKEILRQALGEAFGDLGDTTDNVHGAFGQSIDWPAYEQAVRGWLHAPEHEDRILDVIDALLPGTRWHSSDTDSFKSRMLHYVRTDLIRRLHEVASDPSYTQTSMSERAANAGILPMFGFPTRVRLLYTRWPRQGYPWPPEAGTVDRDLGVAISQFAPGSQTVKDKAVHTAAGVVELSPAGKIVQSRNGFDPPLPEGNPQPIGLCDACQAVLRLPPLAVPPQGGQEPARQQCPVCRHPDATVRILDAREPMDFFTDLEPQDFEGQFEWTPRSTRPSLTVNKPQESTQTIGNATVCPVSDQVLSINDNGGQGGFDFRSVKIDGVPKDGAFAAIDEEDGTVHRRVSGSGPAWRIALLSRRVTDALLVGISSWPEGIFADPLTVEGRAAWYSLGFLLRLAGGAELDVDAQELQASFRALEEGGRAVGEAFLCDQLENGAGYCRELSRPERFERLLRQAHPNVADSIGARWSLVARSDTQPAHALECDTSCNRCLRDFQNLPYHGLLDWRLALDMARVATTGGGLDLTSGWGDTANLWNPLVKGDNSPISTLVQKLGYGPQREFGTLTGYAHSGFKRILLLRHPLWGDDHPLWMEARLAAQSQNPGFSVHASNPFRVLRRPADCVASAR